MYTTIDDYKALRIYYVTIHGKCIPQERRDSEPLSLRGEDFAYLAEAAFETKGHSGVGNRISLQYPEQTRAYLGEIYDGLLHNGLDEYGDWLMNTFPTSPSAWLPTTDYYPAFEFESVAHAWLDACKWRNHRTLPTRDSIVGMTSFDASKMLALYNYIFNCPFVSQGFGAAGAEDCGLDYDVSIDGAATHYNDRLVSSSPVLSKVTETIPEGQSASYPNRLLVVTGWTESLAVNVDLNEFGGNGGHAANAATSVKALFALTVRTGSSSYVFQTRFQIVDLVQTDADGFEWSAANVLTKTALVDILQSFTAFDLSGATEYPRTTISSDYERPTLVDMRVVTVWTNNNLDCRLS